MRLNMGQATCTKGWSIMHDRRQSKECEHSRRMRCEWVEMSRDTSIMCVTGRSMSIRYTTSSGNCCDSDSRYAKVGKDVLLQMITQSNNRGSPTMLLCQCQLSSSMVRTTSWLRFHLAMNAIMVIISIGIEDAELNNDHQKQWKESKKFNLRSHGKGSSGQSVVGAWFQKLRL